MIFLSACFRVPFLAFNASSTLTPFPPLKKPRNGAFLMADGARFELALGFRPKHTFQACAFNHSATHPDKRLYTLFFSFWQEKIE